MAQAAPGDVLRRHEDGRARLQGREGGAPPLPRAPGRRPRRPAAAAQPWSTSSSGNPHCARVARSRRLSRRARKGSFASSASQGMDSRSQPCIGGRSSVSRSTPCSSRTTSGRCRTIGTRRSSRSSLRSAGRGVAVQTIKSIALAPWDGRPQTASTWYEPLTDPADISLAVDWVLGREGIFLNTVGDVKLLPRRAGGCRGVRRRAPERRTHERARAASLTEAALRLANVRERASISGLRTAPEPTANPVPSPDSRERLNGRAAGDGDPSNWPSDYPTMVFVSQLRVRSPRSM